MMSQLAQLPNQLGRAVRLCESGSHIRNAGEADQGHGAGRKREPLWAILPFHHDEVPDLAFRAPVQRGLQCYAVIKREGSSIRQASRAEKKLGG